jgi:hypothetical protein
VQVSTAQLKRPTGNSHRPHWECATLAPNHVRCGAD